MHERLARVSAAVLGCLLENPEPMRQTEIAIAVKATQARVSQVLDESDRTGLTERTRHGWRVAHPAAAFDLCVSQRSWRTTVESWYGLEPGLRQVESCVDLARRSAVDYRVSGDWAADRLAPWRIPLLATVHTDRRLDLEAAGFVPSDPNDATLHTVVGPIPLPWRTDPRIATRMTGSDTIDWHLAPVHEIARQILVTGGPDADQAVEQLRDQFLAARSAVATQVLSA